MTFLRSRWRNQWVVMGRVGRMGRVGKRGQHLTAWRCRAHGSDNADTRPHSRPYRLSGLSRPKIIRDERDLRDERDEREVADNARPKKREEGKTYQQIADELGYKDGSSIQKKLKNAGK